MSDDLPIVLMPPGHPDLAHTASSIVPGAAVMELERKPQPKSQAACYWSVDTRVKRDGGRMRLGWLLCWWPPYFVEAVHHAVWEQPNGNLLDIVHPPYAPSFDKTSLFIPDESISITIDAVIPVRNRYVALGKWPTSIRRYVDHAKAFFEADRELKKAMVAKGYKFGPSLPQPKFSSQHTDLIRLSQLSAEARRRVESSAAKAAGSARKRP